VGEVDARMLHFRFYAATRPERAARLGLERRRLSVNVAAGGESAITKTPI
jgi:hypothetical protein